MFAQLASMILRGVREFDNAVHQALTAQESPYEDVGGSSSSDYKDDQE